MGGSTTLKTRLLPFNMLACRMYWTEGKYRKLLSVNLSERT